MTALNVLEGIVGSLLVVETKVILVGLFVLELLDVSPDDDTDVWVRGRGKMRRNFQQEMAQKCAYRVG